MVYNGLDNIYTTYKIMKEKKYNIGAVSRITGLSTHAIRAWEKRHHAVDPERSEDNNRRLYSENDLQKLSLLKEATGLGFNIGNIANMNIDELKSIVWKQKSREVPEKSGDTMPDVTVQDYIEKSMEAIRDYNPEKLEELLSMASVEFGNIKTVEQFVIPMAALIGDEWSRGILRIAQEHMATETLRTYLISIISNSLEYKNSPIMVVSTPSGQLHDLGALISGALAATEGWKVLFLGPNLPSEEIAGAIKKTGAKVVAMSIVYPCDDARIHNELVNLRTYLNKTTIIIVGGSGSKNYLKTLEKIDAEHIPDITEFRYRLKEIRNSSV